MVFQHLSLFTYAVVGYAWGVHVNFYTYTACYVEQGRVSWGWVGRNLNFHLKVVARMLR